MSKNKESVINPTLAPEPPVPALHDIKYFSGTLSSLPVATYFTGTGHCCTAVEIFLFSV